MAPDDPSRIVPRRWLRCSILHALISSLLWLVCGSRFPEVSLWHPEFPRLLPSWHGLARYLVFLASQIGFLWGEMAVIRPEHEDAATFGDIVFGALKLAWRMIVGAPLQRSFTDDTFILSRRLQTTANLLLFAILCAMAGCLSLVSLSVGKLGLLEKALQGAALGMVYTTVHVYRKRTILSFPIIQRRFFFDFKLGLPEVARNALKLSIAALPFAVLVVNTNAVGALLDQKALFACATTFFVSALFTTLCWELCHHLLQVVHTRRHIFSPHLGTSAAETSPSELLLIAFEDTDKASLAYYLAVLDMLMVSENNVDTWRRAALFEESGETYQKVISECLRPLDTLTLKLARGVGGSLIEDDGKDILKEQMHDPLGQFKGGSIDQIFKDFQLCSWCARIVAALTSISKNEDKYGVAQLRGCNSAVISSLLSCLLVIEVSLGRRSSIQSFDLLSPNSIKWTVPSRGVLKDLGRRQDLPFKKKTIAYKKAYAMADILRTSVYQIVAAFKAEMVLSGFGSNNFSLAERDWLRNGKPLYGTREMHLEKVSLFLDFKVS